MRKSTHNIPRYAARTAGAQRISDAPYFGGATHITPRLLQISPYYGIGAHRCACPESQPKAGPQLDNHTIAIVPKMADAENQTAEYTT